jgi:hypothetical protein
MEKLGGGPQIGQLVCFGSGQKLFFSGAVHLSNLLSQHERLSYMTFHECVRVVRLQFKRDMERLLFQVSVTARH